MGRSAMYYSRNNFTMDIGSYERGSWRELSPNVVPCHLMSRCVASPFMKISIIEKILGDDPVRPGHGGRAERTGEGEKLICGPGDRNQRRSMSRTTVLPETAFTSIIYSVPFWS